MKNFKLTFLLSALLVIGIHAKNPDFCLQFQGGTTSETEYKLVIEVLEQKIKVLIAKEARIKTKEGFFARFSTYGIEGNAKCKMKKMLKQLEKENPEFAKMIRELAEKDMQAKEQNEIEASLAAANECKKCFEYLRAKMIVDQFEHKTGL